MKTILIYKGYGSLGRKYYTIEKDDDNIHWKEKTVQISKLIVEVAMERCGARLPKVLEYLYEQQNTVDVLLGGDK